MVDPKLPLYVHPQETWDAAKCAKMAKRKSKDAPFKGYLGSSASMPPAYGPVRYNGGCIRADEWFQGENRPLPKVAEGFEIIVVRNWGWQIIRTEPIAPQPIVTNGANDGQEMGSPMHL